jgi:hypothetical protein
LNIKRGLLSAFQNTMDDLKTDTVTKEVFHFFIHRIWRILILKKSRFISINKAYQHISLTPQARNYVFSL